MRKAFKPPPLRSGLNTCTLFALVLALVLFLLASLAHGQISQFTFDATGNLTAQTVETVAPPEILSHPQDQVVIPGEAASFSVVAANVRGLSYRWRLNGIDIPGATGEVLLLLNVAGGDEGLYSVVLANNSGSVTSAPARLMIDRDADGLPDSWESSSFGNLAQNPTGDFDGDGVSNLSEFQEGTDPLNSGSRLFHLTVIADGGSLSLSPSRLTFTNGESVTVTVTANSNEKFHGWTGDALGTNNPLVLSMTQDLTVFAHFNFYEIAWTNSANGDWHAPVNWSPNLVPAEGDAVAISSGVTITANGIAECASLVFGTFGTAPTLTGAGTLTIYTNCVWGRGTMSGTGRTIIAPGARLDIINSQIINLNGRTLENGGTTVWTGVAIATSGAVITNRPGALFETRTSDPLNFFAGSGSRFDNAGTFRKIINPGTLLVYNGLAFNNYGLVEIQTGGLSLNGGGTHTGSVELGGGTTLEFGGGTYYASAASSIVGPGNLTVSGGTVTLDGLVNASGTHTFRAGIANLNGNYICTNNTMIFSGGTANLNGVGAVTPAVVHLNLGTLGGSSTMTVLSEMNWTGGTMGGTGRTVIPSGVTLNIANNNIVTLDRRILDNAGTVLRTGVAIATSGAVITNRPGALFETRTSDPLNFFAGSGSRFDNAGTFRKIINPGTLLVYNGLAFNNYGLVEIQSGGLSLNGGGTHTGSVELGGGTTLEFGGGTYYASAASSIVGPGNLTVSGATVTLDGLVNASGTHTFRAGAANLNGNYISTNNTMIFSGGTANFNGVGAVTPAVVNLNIGTLGGSSTVTVLSEMNWTGGTMSGTGRTMIPSDSTLNIANNNIVTLNSRTLDNAGTVLRTGVAIATTAAVITNRPGALFETRTSDPLNFPSSSGSRFDNAGTFRKVINPGTLNINSGLAFNNYGTVEISSGILAAFGGYNSSSDAVLHCALGGTTAGTGYGRLQVGGPVALNGALSVAFINGFQPALYDSFTVLTAGTRNGAFTSFFYPSNESAMQISNTANSVVVRVTDILNGPPQITADLPALQVFYAGRTMTQSVSVVGASPFNYQWKKNGADLSDGQRISGSQSSILTIVNASAADAGNYQVLVNNAGGSAQSRLGAVTVQGVPKFNAGGAGWTLQGTTAPVMNVSNVTLTSGLGNTARSTFYNGPLYIVAFTASYIYSDVGGGGADGITFCMQKDPRGASALGGLGNGLGYSGITPSAALAMNIYAPNTRGISFRQNGTLPAPGGYTPAGPVNIASGNPIHVSLLYTGGLLNVTLVESNSPNIFRTNYVVNLPAIVGAETAFVGFTGADGAVASTQVVSNFTFVPITGISAERPAAGMLALSWPGTIGGYTVQAISSLPPGSSVWQNLTNAVEQVDGRNQITISPLTGAQYYRLSISLGE